MTAALGKLNEGHSEVSMTLMCLVRVQGFLEPKHTEVFTLYHFVAVWKEAG